MIKKKILYILHEPYHTGAPLVILNLLKRIDRSKYEPVVMFPYYGPLVDYFKRNDIKISLIAKKKGYIYKILFLYIFKIFAVIKDSNVDIVHINSRVLYPLVLLSKLIKKKTLFHIHESFEDFGLVYAALIRLCIILSDIVIFTSVASMMSIIKRKDNERYKVIYNGVDISNFYDTGKRSDKEIHIIMIGYISPIKGQIYLLKTFIELLKEFNNIKLDFIGEIKNRLKYQFYYQQLETIIRENDISGRVKFHGFVYKMDRILKEADIIAHTSLMESFPLSLLESMSCGRPVVAFNAGGVGEIVEDEKTGYLVDKEDLQTLRERLSFLIRHEDIRNKFGRAGRKRAEKYFSIDKMVSGMEDVYDLM
ncbi:MAG: glycosyltransferase family 4 protein [Nitrospirota bacterium]